MGLVLIFLLVALLIGWFAYALNKDDKPNRLMYTVISFVVTGIILLMVTALIIGVSYASYLENRAFYDATVEQYRGAITMYKDYAVIDMEKTRAAFTDFKYQGYQEAMSKMIVVLQSRIVKYNRSFILKKVKNNSWFFDWLIIANDSDMKIIRMVE